MASTQDRARVQVPRDTAGHRHGLVADFINADQTATGDAAGDDRPFEKMLDGSEAARWLARCNCARVGQFILATYDEASDSVRAVKRLLKREQ